MLLIMLATGAACLIVFAGFAIIAKWVLPARIYAAIAHAVDRFFTFFFKLCVVAVALLIVGFVGFVVFAGNP